MQWFKEKLDFLRMNKIFAFIILILVIMLVMIISRNKNLEPIIETIVERDTVVKTDTVKVYKTHHQLIPLIIHDTITLDGDSLKVYNTEVSDSLLKGNIISYVDGTLVSTDFSYTAFIPRDSVFIKETNTIIYPLLKPHLRIGGHFSANSFGPTASWNMNKTTLRYHYNITRKTHEAGIEFRLWQKN